MENVDIPERITYRDLVSRLGTAPSVVVDFGPKHPDNPQYELKDTFESYVKRYTFLQKMTDYATFLGEFDGVEIYEDTANNDAGKFFMSVYGIDILSDCDENIEDTHYFPVAECFVSVGGVEHSCLFALDIRKPDSPVYYSTRAKSNSSMWQECGLPFVSWLSAVLELRSKYINAFVTNARRETFA